VTGSRYVRKVHEALERQAARFSEDARVELRPKIGPDREADLAMHVGPRLVLIEVKSIGPQGKVDQADTYGFLRQLRAALDGAPPAVAGGLLVTDRELPSAGRLLRETPQIRAVRWRSPRDDDRLAPALASLLGTEVQPPQ
jgi:hypothetical protein